MKYYNEYKGLNSRLDELQAAILRVKLRYLDEWNHRRQRVSQLYGQLLNKNSFLTLPAEPDGCRSCWHLYVVRSTARDQLQTMLSQRGIGTMIHYPLPPYRQQAYSDLGMQKGRFPIADILSEQVLSLPIGPHISDEAVDFICSQAN
jgi:dTDP-4-amino-4,6-dideoxygalactose transaminase